MKRVFSIIMAFVIAISCCAAYGFSAADNDSDTKPSYLLGDVDIDKNITIFDATAIQRDLAGLTELSGLQKELADVTSDGETILSATMIQRHLASVPTGYAIGEPAGDKNEGVIYPESVTWYSTDGVNTIADPYDLYFSTAYPDVAFVTDTQAIDIYKKYYGYDNETKPIEYPGSTLHIYALGNDTVVQFDYENMLMVFSDYSSSLTMNGRMVFNPFGESFKPNTKLYRMTDLDRYYGGDPIMATFAYDEVPMLRRGDDILIPLQTCSDLFLSKLSQFVQYNGKNIFSIIPNMSLMPTLKDYWDLYCDTDKRTTISKEWAQVNYYELCNAFDARYGLQAAHNISTFDSYFARKGIKAKMLSGDLEAIEKATMEISTLLFEDFHSASAQSSPFLDKEIVPDMSMYSPLYINRAGKMNRIKSTRTLTLGDVQPYERRGDTVFITFDSFTFTSIDAHYADGCEPTPDGDTVDLFAYSLRRLQNEDSDAKNVVIDLSCNGGGTVISCAYALQAICGQSTICLQNPNTWALHQCDYKFDLNLDGVLDDKDVSMLGMGFNVAVITSDCSFSCGNMLPCTLDALDDRILLLGQTSGGGACEVGYLSTSTGGIMQMSSENRFVTMKNGYIRDIDGGVAPDVFLTLSRMFDRDYIVDLIGKQFG